MQEETLWMANKDNALFLPENVKAIKESNQVGKRKIAVIEPDKEQKIQETEKKLPIPKKLNAIDWGPIKKEVVGNAFFVDLKIGDFVAIS